MIYFIQDNRTREIKIGISTDPPQRLKELQTAHASELLLIAVMDGTRVQEQALHQLFTRKRGEWFEPSRDLLAFIREKAVAIAPAFRHTRAYQGSGRMPKWKPELEGDGFIESFARLASDVLPKHKERTEEMIGIIYAQYKTLYNQLPEECPKMSLAEFQSELLRLVDIQNA